MAGKILLGILALMLLFGVFFNPIMDGLTDWRTKSVEEDILVTTGGGVTSLNITLSYDLFQAKTAELHSIVSSNTAVDTPVGIAYWEDDRHLTVGGLAASLTRILTVDYRAESDLEAMRIAGPFLGAIVILIIIVMIIKSMSKGRR
jgi:hypothetical protein